MTAIALAILMLFAQSPAERRMGLDAMILETPGTRTIAKGDQSNVDDARQVLVRTEAEWTKLWQQHAPDHPKPAVDFSNLDFVLQDAAAHGLSLTLRTVG